jgi:Ras-related protein Rab-1A
MSIEPRQHDHLFKILLLGNSGVGKSNLLLRYVDDIYKEDLGPTIGVDFKICSRMIDDKLVKMQIWDTAGQERFRTITISYYRGSHGILVVYDVTDRTSFQHVRSWMQEIQKYAKEGASILLVGNKVDLTSKRAVSTDEGQELAHELGVGFIETSARNAHNIENMFERLARDIRKQLPPQEDRSQRVRLTVGPAESIGGTMTCSAC